MMYLSSILMVTCIFALCRVSSSVVDFVLMIGYIFSLTYKLI